MVIRVNFYAVSAVEDSLIQFAVIVSRMNGKWVFCRHRDRETYEVPGGHREYEKNPGGCAALQEEEADGIKGHFIETPMEAAERELKEETGATRYEIEQVCAYSVCRDDGEETFGLLAFAELYEVGELHSEIAEIRLFDMIPENLTYPEIQPKLQERVEKYRSARAKKDRMKVIITDLDRTLLRTDKMLSDYTAGVLADCQKRGMKVVFATARPVRTVARYLEQVACDAVIYHNGAFAEVAGKRVGEPHLISIAEVRELLGRLRVERPNRKLSVEIADTLYANFDVKEFWSYTGAVESDFTDLPERDADKILIEVRSSKECEELDGMLWDEVYGETADGKLYLVMNRKATKFGAVQDLAEYWGIPAEDMIAFGDDVNDIGMLKGCGIGVSVANGLEEVREASDLIAETNDEDGVAVFLENFYSREA